MQSTELEQKGFDIRLLSSALGYYKVLLSSGDGKNTCDLQDGENIFLYKHYSKKSG